MVPSWDSKPLWEAADKLRNNMDAAGYTRELYNRLIQVVGSAGNGKMEALQKVQTA